MGNKDVETIRQTLRGNRDAYGALVDNYKGMVFAVALNITGSYSDSEDVVQEAFLQAYQKLRSLSNPAKFASWLYTITKRIALRFLQGQALKYPILAALVLWLISSVTYFSDLQATRDCLSCAEAFSIIR